MIGNKQGQDLSEGATGLQAGRDLTVVHVGLDYQGVKEVALDVAKAVLFELRGEAIAEAQKRAEEVTESFLDKLNSEFPEGLQKANDPDFQHNLFVMQKEYARCGDKELGELLIDLMLERTKQEARSLRQIVLSESMTTAPKLTNGQISTLAVLFLIRYTRNHHVGNWDQFGAYLDLHFRPFIDDMETSRQTFQHLEFAGCGTHQLSVVDLGEAFATHYPGLFTNGFTEEIFNSKGFTHPTLARASVGRCINDPSKLQVAALNELVVQQKMDVVGGDPSDLAKMNELLHTNRMSANETKDKVVEVRPYMQGFFEAWASTGMSGFTLTSVGMAIGHAAVVREVGMPFGDLSIWIS